VVSGGWDAVEWAVVGGPGPGARRMVRAAKRARWVGAMDEVGGEMVVEEYVTSFG
jgi:hypothetical protein